MKTKYYYLILIVFITAIFCAGCYTQVATSEDDMTKDQVDYAYQDQEELYDSSVVLDDSNYGDDADIIINKYYYNQYPDYSRYYWGYYPSIYVGFSFGDWYYAPFYPWGWCGSYWYYPSYCYPYYVPYYYPYNNYYWNGYNDNYKYRERTADFYNLRNNSGLRNSFVSRGTLTGNYSRTLSKDTRTRNDSRDVLLNRNTTSRTRNLDLGKTDTKKETKTTRNNLTSHQTELRKSYNKLFSQRTKGNSTTPPRREDSRKKDITNNSSPNTKKFNSDIRQRIETRSRNESRTERRTTESPRSYSPPQRTYSPPSNNTSPRSYSPPSSNNSSSGRRR
jgi:hypothetical protein